MTEIEEAVAAWIRAEYHFRLGPTAYQTQEAGWLVEAERRLRHALTGKHGLRKAFAIVGGKETPEEWNKRRKKK